jgi:hypothetical protein
VYREIFQLGVHRDLHSVAQFGLKDKENMESCENTKTFFFHNEINKKIKERKGRRDRTLEETVHEEKRKKRNNKLGIVLDLS